MKRNDNDDDDDDEEEEEEEEWSLSEKWWLWRYLDLNGDGT